MPVEQVETLVIGALSSEKKQAGDVNEFTLVLMGACFHRLLRY